LNNWRLAWLKNQLSQRLNANQSFRLGNTTDALYVEGRERLSGNLVFVVFVSGN
jgi:hypothetical protein